MFANMEGVDEAVNMLMGVDGIFGVNHARIPDNGGPGGAFAGQSTNIFAEGFSRSEGMGATLGEKK